MLLRAMVACMVVFGAFAIAAWAVAPREGWSELFSAAPRAAPAVAEAEAPVAPPSPALPAKSVRTFSFQRPDAPPGSFDTALLTPEHTAPSERIAPAPLRPSLAPDTRREPAKAFRCPRGTPAASGPPTIAQIARIENALKLSPEQEQHWRPVQLALIEIARHFESPNPDPRRGAHLISVERMQSIYLMAGPFVLSLRDEQKREARNLACSMGLGAVAALI